MDFKEDNSDDEYEEDWVSVCMYQSKRIIKYGNAHQAPPAKKRQRTNTTAQQNCTIGPNCTHSNDIFHSAKVHERTIIHIDIDCFYAQVEMILNPCLQTQPLGIQQKHIVVTCNYVARERGVSKLMRISDAIKKCPDLVLVNGEDLTKYREFSKRIHDLLLRVTPSVERLGFDENFLDVTSLVQARIESNNCNGNNTLNPIGFVYEDKHGKETEKCTCGCHQRLTIGSILASEIREMIFEQIGLTCCAGVAHNKILAKLIGECHKPNKQTILFPDNQNSFMQSLPARKIPGIGCSSAKRLQSIGITSVLELQSCTLEALQAEFGVGSVALNLKRLSYGIDDADVVPSGSPKSISEEDTYHECISISDVFKNLKGLNEKLVSRLTDDLGLPQTVRLTILRKTGKLAGDRKETRQCPIPPKFSSSGISKTAKSEFLLNISMELFKKIVNIKQGFNIKMLNVCLTKFYKPSNNGRSGMSRFFCSSGHKTERLYSAFVVDDRKLDRHGNKGSSKETDPIANSHKEAIQKGNDIGVDQECSTEYYELQHKSESLSHCDVAEHSLIKTKGYDKTATGNGAKIPKNIDMDIFNSLPAELQKQLMQEWSFEQQKQVLPNKSMKNSKNAPGLLKYLKRK